MGKLLFQLRYIDASYLHMLLLCMYDKIFSRKFKYYEWKGCWKNKARKSLNKNNSVFLPAGNWVWNRIFSDLFLEQCAF